MNSLENVNSKDFDYILDYVKVLEAANCSLFAAFFEAAELFKIQVEQVELGAKLVGGDENSAVWLVADDEVAAGILADFAKTDVGNAKTALKTEQSGFENFDLEEYMFASRLASDLSSLSDYGLTADLTSGVASSAVADFAFAFASGTNLAESGVLVGDVASGGSGVAANKVFGGLLPVNENLTSKTSDVGFTWDIPSEFDVLVELVQGISAVNAGQSGGLSQNDGNSQSSKGFGNTSTAFESLSQSGGNFSDEKVSKTQSIEDFANEIAGIFSSGLAASRQSLAHKVQK